MSDTKSTFCIKAYLHCTAITSRCENGCRFFVFLIFALGVLLTMYRQCVVSSQ